MQYLGLLAILLVLGFGAFALFVQKPNKRQSFSQHVAQYPELRRAFGVVFSLATVSYYAFLAFFLGPALNLSAVYYLLLAVGFLCQLVIAWVPADKGRSLFWHNIAAYLLAFLLPVIAGLLFFADPGPLLALSILVHAYFLAPLTLIILYYFTNAKQYFLYYQIGYFAWFWVIVFIVTYWST